MLKDYPEQSYNDLIAKLVEIYRKSILNSKYDEFLHQAQLSKMRELWNNPEDEEWDDA